MKISFFTVASLVDHVLKKLVTFAGVVFLFFTIMALGVPPSAHGAPLETIMVAATRSAPTLSNTVLAAGQTYIIEASGVIDFWPDNQHDGVDAMQIYRHDHRDADYSCLEIDGTRLRELVLRAGGSTALRNDHTYQVRYVGRGERLSLRINDWGHYDNNSGSLQVKIMRASGEASPYFDEAEIDGGPRPNVDVEERLPGAGREIHTRDRAGVWSTNVAGIVNGSIPNDYGYSFYLLPRTVSLDNRVDIIFRLRYKNRVDYNGAGLALIASESTNSRQTQIRLQITAREKMMGVRGWRSANESQLSSRSWDRTGRDIRIGEWYTLRMVIDGTSTYGYLDGTLIGSATIPELASFPRQLHIAPFIIEADAEFELLSVNGSAATIRSDESVWNVEVDGGPRPHIDLEERATGDADGDGTTPTTEEVAPGSITGCGTVVEIRDGEIGNSGGSVALPGGARLTIPPESLAHGTRFWLVQGEAGNGANRAVALSDVYYAVKEGTFWFSGPTSITIPFTPTSDEVSVYVYRDSHFYYTVPAEIDKAHGIAVVRYPHISAREVPGELIHDRGLGGTGSYHPMRTGYLVGRAGIPKPELGAPGTRLKLPGHVFEVVADVQTTPEFMHFVANTLQEAYEIYRPVYIHNDDNWFSFIDDLYTWWRMEVYIRPVDGADAEYAPFDARGLENIFVDPAKGQRDLYQFRSTLFHELFHGIQDGYCNKVGTWAAGNTWWNESTAEWAGNYYGLNAALEDVIDTYVATLHPAFLSVPIRESSAGDNFYGYSTLIAFVEEENPGYVRESMTSYQMVSPQLYQYLVDEHDLAVRYKDYLQRILAATLGDAIYPWHDYIIHEFDNRTVALHHPTEEIGDGSWESEAITNDARRRMHTRELTVEPLTTRFVRVIAGGRMPGVASGIPLTKPRLVRVELKEDGRPSDNAFWLAQTAKGSARMPRRPGSLGRMYDGLAAVRGMGTEFNEFWVAVFNPSPYGSRSYSVTVYIEREEEESRPPAAGTIVARGPFTSSGRFTSGDATGFAEITIYPGDRYFEATITGTHSYYDGGAKTSDFNGSFSGSYDGDHTHGTMNSSARVQCFNGERVDCGLIAEYNGINVSVSMSTRSAGFHPLILNFTVPVVSGAP